MQQPATRLVKLTDSGTLMRINADDFDPGLHTPAAEDETAEDADKKIAAKDERKAVAAVQEKLDASEADNKKLKAQVAKLEKELEEAKKPAPAAAPAKKASRKAE